jgi:hypothetical protein
LAGNGEAVLSLKQKGLYIPFLEEGKLFYIIYDKEKLFAVQNGKTTPVFDVKDYDINNWQRNVISTLQRIVRENYKENPLFLKKTGNLIDRLHDSFIGFCGFYGGLGAFATLVSSFFVNNSIYALGAGLLLLHR